MTDKKTKTATSRPAAEKTIKRTFKLTVRVDGATKEFSEGMGVGVLGSCEVTFNLTAAKYASPIFAMSLLDQQKALRDDLIKMGVEEVTAPARKARAGKKSSTTTEPGTAKATTETAVTPAPPVAP
jgi:hypothetical protein